mmetsp:Transcript_36597/g.104584  ORF Transcript_36597/g.104584 Transcript_36597/m.104584 type:complete len:481 (+) Transcript_36597:201-1643(+)
MAALALQLRDHALFCLVADAPAREQAPGQVLLVEALEDVLVLQEAEDRDDLLEARVDLHVAGHALEAFPEHVVHEQGEVLRSASVLVQEGLERLLQRQLEVLVLFEGLAHEDVVLLLEQQDRGDEGDGVPDLLGVAEDVAAGLANVVDHDPLHLLQRLRGAAEEQIHALEVLHLVVLEHPGAARALHGDQGLVVGEDPLLVAEVLDLLQGRLVEVALHARPLLTDALLGLLQVIRARVLRDVLHGLVPVEPPRVVEEVVLEALAVDVPALHAKLHKHVHRMLQQDAVHLLAPALGRDVLEHQGQEPGLDPRMPRHVLAEDHQPHLVDRHLAVLRHEVPIHVHEDVADHDHGRLVVVPLLLDLLQQVAVWAVDAAQRDRLKVIRDDPLHAVVEQLAVLVQHKVVGVPVQLLEGQRRGVVLVDLVDGVLQRLPGSVRLLLVHRVPGTELPDALRALLHAAGEHGPRGSLGPGSAGFRGPREP